MKRKLILGAIGALFISGLLLLLLASSPAAAESCPNGSTHCPGDPTGDGLINCLDITQSELCILYPGLYPKEDYPGWDSNGDNLGPNGGDMLGMGYRMLGQWPHNRVYIQSPDELPYCTAFSAMVRVTYVVEFDSGIYDIIYDSSVLEVTGVSAGKVNFVTVPASYSFPQGAGMVRIVNDIPGTSGVCGSGYLSKINFHVIGSACDASDMGFNESASWLKDKAGVEINATWFGDSFHIAAAPATPSPTKTSTVSPTVSPTLTSWITPPPTATVSPTVSPTCSPTPTPTETGWAYSQRGTVTASVECGDLSNYQVMLTLHYGSGTNNGSDFYLNSDCQADFDDVRFTKSDGASLLDYWVEKVNVGTDATVWVEFDEISPSSTDFYIYYGNPAAESASDGEATFLFFDDFEDGVVDAAKWTEIYEDGGDWVKEEGGVISILGSASGFGNRAMIRSMFIPSDVNVKVHSRIKIENIQKDGSRYYDHFTGISNEYYYASMEQDARETTLLWRTGYMWHDFDSWLLSVAWDLDDTAVIPALNATYHDLISWIEPIKTCHTIVDWVEFNVSSTHPFNTSQAAYLRISLEGEGNENSDGCIADVFADYVFARKYCGPEPEFSWGPYPTPTPTSPVCANDDFNDNAINPFCWIDYYLGTGMAVNETNQRLEISFSANSTGDSETGVIGCGYVSLCRLYGDFDIQADYNVIDWPTQNGVRIGLGLSEVEGQPLRAVERASFGDSNDCPGWPREVYCTQFDDGTKGITATSQVSGKLRLVRNGTTLSGYYYSNSSWVLIHSGPITDEEFYYTISAWSHDFAFTGQEVRVAFDNFVVNSGSLNCGPKTTPTPTPTATPTLPLCSQDDFNDNAINPSCWTTLPQGTGPTINETNQRLEIVFPANCSNDPTSGAFGEGYQSVCRLSGDFDMQVDYSLIEWPLENGVRMGFGVSAVPMEPGIGHTPIERVSSGSSEVYLTHFDDGIQGTTATTDLSGKLRLVRAGTTMSGYYFGNGSWVLVHAGPVTAADVYIVLSSWSHDGLFADKEVRLAFDNFAINQGALNCEPITTPTSTPTCTGMCPTVTPTVSPTCSPTIT